MRRREGDRDSLGERQVKKERAGGRRGGRGEGM